jgi:thiol-disulfide isomerase/thioredoxin
VEYYFGRFLVNSKCLNYTVLVSFFHSTYMANFTTSIRTDKLKFRFPYMKSTVLLLLLLKISFMAPAQQAKEIKLGDLQQLLTASNERIQVINFWATWCAPCVKEIPLFEELNLANEEVDVTLVSMDYDLDPNPDKVNRFVARKKIQSTVVILAEQNPNNWIDKIDKDWQGALPTTLVVNTKTGKRKLVQRELHEGELEKLIAEVR